ncbi:MAG: hypothetical protein HFK10_02165 [Clostridia bacterium]|jgi:prephenate dehydratase|nr:hypothetical protein [Clostridia bacterium]
MDIAYLGDEYSHSFLAAQRFGGVDLKPYKSITAAVEAVANGETQAAAVPIENSIEGSVRECLDALTALPVYMAAETVLPIEHCLIGTADARPETVKTVYSHPQALSQCRAYLERAGLESVAVASTSEGLQRVTDSTTGAIARCARPGQKVLAEHIEDYANNATRFVLLKNTPSTVGGKVSVMFETVNAPGALLKALTVIADFGLNMVHIESRPKKGAMGRYIFFVDFLFGGDKEELLHVLDVLSRQTGYLKFLGRYEAATEAN